MSRPRILFVDDEDKNLKVFRLAFEDDFEVTTCQSPIEALKLVEEQDFEVILSDERMPGMRGAEFLARCCELVPNVTRVMITAYEEPEILRDAINKGHVYDWVAKPWDDEALERIIERGAQRSRQFDELRKARDEKRLLEEKVSAAYDFQHIVGAETGLREVMSVVHKVATQDVNVLVTGESGTGKELVARAIHQLSNRASKSFIAVNCPGLAKELIESELFGHEKGAFTGALSMKRGRFELADGGTLFLDEIGDLPLDVQVKLLRVLQEREFERVGGTVTRRVDVRLVAATNADLESEVDRGRFREDLFYRLNVIRVRMPTLAERKQDIPLLARHFLGVVGRETGREFRLSAGAIAKLEGYDWPGNVRQLENTVRSAVILADQEGYIEANDIALPESRRRPPPDWNAEAEMSPLRSPRETSLKDAIYEEERARIIDALRRARGNKAEAARSLDVARTTFNYWCQKYKVE